MCQCMDTSELLLNGESVAGCIGDCCKWFAVRESKLWVALCRTVFAMPECGIGLFPDIGSSFFLTRLPGQLGLWLGLTGARLEGK